MLSQKTYYTHRPHPYQNGSFQIFLMQGMDQDLVADYLLLDSSEDPDMTEKTVMNLVTLLNGRKDLIDQRDQTNTRLYFQRLDEDDQGRARVLFRSYCGVGLTTENALLTYNREKMDV